MAETRDEALHRVLTLVAEGRLTADEAAPILDALAAANAAARAGAQAAQHAHPGHPQPPIPPRPPERPAAPVLPGTNQTTGSAAGERPRFARIQVIENGRRAVDLRVPVGIGRFALSKVPGLSSEQIDEVQDALASGTHGPILDIQDADGDGVRISLE
ncbi:MAG TPA: hypothetical protein VKR30_09590 [Candidatus Limnocylindrales bacterium]|nr:hypothetical protein [Candidatus Limnocylindrales bacterium]